MELLHFTRIMSIYFVTFTKCGKFHIFAHQRSMYETSMHSQVNDAVQNVLPSGS